MKCEEIDRVMMDYLDDSLDKIQKAEIDQHILTCERCKNEIATFHSMLHIMDEAKMEQPGETVKINFYHMLRTEMAKMEQTKSGKKNKPSVFRWANPMLRIAAGFALLIAGVLFGLMIKQGKDKSETGQLTELKSEVKEVKEILIFSKLKEESASERIAAVNYAEEIANPDQKVISALIGTLNNDINVNVRMAAAYSLAKFADHKQVRDALVESLGKQTEPILQVVLMNILTEKKETKAVKPMQEIISNKNTLREVKDVAQKGIKVLL